MNVTTLSGQQRRRHRDNSRFNVEGSPSPTSRMPPILRLDSTGEVIRSDAPGHGRANGSRHSQDRDESISGVVSTNGIIKSVMSPRCHIHSTGSHLQANYNSSKSVLGGLNALEQFLQTRPQQSDCLGKLDMHMASHIKMQYPKQANSKGMSSLGGHQHLWNSMIRMNYSSLPPGVFPCHVFQAIQSQNSIRIPGAPTSTCVYPNKPSLVDTVMSMRRVQPVQPTNRSQCTKSMSDSKITTAVDTPKTSSQSASHSSSLGNIAVNQNGEGAGYCAKCFEPPIPATHTGNKIICAESFCEAKLGVTNCGHSTDESVSCQNLCYDRRGKTVPVAVDINSKNDIKMEKSSAKISHEQSSESACCENIVETRTCDNVHIPANIPSPNSSSLDTEIMETAVSQCTEYQISHLQPAGAQSQRENSTVSALTSGAVKDVESFSKNLTSSNDMRQHKAEIERVVRNGCVSTILERKPGSTEQTVQNRAETAKRSTFLFNLSPLPIDRCDECEIDDSFWSESDDEEVDSESQREAIACFANQNQGSIFIFGVDSRSPKQAEREAEEKYRAKVQEAVDIANMSWTQHYPCTQPSRDHSSQVQFICGPDMDDVHTYEADPTCVQEYLATQVAEAAERRKKQPISCDGEEEDVPIDCRFGHGGKDGGECQSQGSEGGEMCDGVIFRHGKDDGECQSRGDEDGHSVIFGSSPDTAYPADHTDREVKGELCGQGDEDDSDFQDLLESDDSSDEDSDEDGEEIGGEDDLVEDGDIDIVFK